MHLAYIGIVSHLSAKNYRNWWKFDKVLTKTNLLSFFGTRCSRVGLELRLGLVGVRIRVRVRLGLNLGLGLC